MLITRLCGSWIGRRTLVHMNLMVRFVQSPMPTVEDGKMGVFQMSAIPDIREVVELDGTDFTVVSRRWTPKSLKAQVIVTLRKF